MSTPTPTMASEADDKSFEPNAKSAATGDGLAQEIDFVTLGMFIIGMLFVCCLLSVAVWIVPRPYRGAAFVC